MAQIDLRNALVEVIDGFSATGAVNQTMTAPADGDTTLTVDGFTKALANGLKFTVVGSTRTYTITSTVGGATPTSIVFTPALATADGIPIDDAVITVEGHVLEIKVGEGTLTFNEKRAMEYVRNRRVIAFVRSGDEDAMDVNFDFIWEFLKSASGEAITIEEAIKGSAAAVTAGWVTSGADPCEPYAVNIRITYTPPCPNIQREIITLKEYRWEGGNHDLKAGTVALSGKCKIAQADLTRVA